MMQRKALPKGPLCQSRGVQMPVVLRVVRTLVVRSARYGQGDRVLGVVQIEAGYAGRESVQVWSAHAGGNPNDGCRSAEHAVPAEAASRPQDRWFFDTQNQPERDPDQSVAAPLNFSVGRRLTHAD